MESPLLYCNFKYIHKYYLTYPCFIYPIGVFTFSEKNIRKNSISLFIDFKKIFILYIHYIFRAYKTITFSRCDVSMRWQMLPAGLA